MCPYREVEVTFLLNHAHSYCAWFHKLLKYSCKLHYNKDPLCLTMKLSPIPLCIIQRKKDIHCPVYPFYFCIYLQNVPYLTGIFSTFCLNCNFFISRSVLAGDQSYTTDISLLPTTS